MTGKRVTSSDVAKMAGVSQTAVSMILNGRTDVSFALDTINRVQAAALALNYKTKKRQVKNELSTERVIAIVSPTLDNPYYSTIIQSLENAAASNGFRAISCTTYRNPDSECSFMSMIQKMGLSGVIFTYIPHHKEKLKVLSLSIPVVVIGDKENMADISTVELDSVAAGRLVGEYLIKLGHRRIAFITTPLQLYSNTQRIRRLEGVKNSLARTDAELSVFESKEDYTRSLYLMNFEHKVGYDFTKSICEDAKVPTAFIGVNDMVAYGILDALADRGISVPEEASVCGFDNIFPSSFHGIKLTTVDSFLVSKGRDAFDLLLRNMQGKEQTHSICRIEYKPKLIVRKTTARLCGPDAD